MLPQQARITLNRQFSSVIKEGTFFRWKFGLGWIAPVEPGVWSTTGKYGVIIPKSVGNAVVRHNCRRVLYHFFMDYQPVPIGYALIVKVHRNVSRDEVIRFLLPKVQEHCPSYTAESNDDH